MMHEDDAVGSPPKAHQGMSQPGTPAGAPSRNVLPQAGLSVLLALLIGVSLITTLDRRSPSRHNVPASASRTGEGPPDTATHRVLAWEMEGVAWSESASNTLAGASRSDPDRPEVGAVIRPAKATPRVEPQVRAVLYPINAPPGSVLPPVTSTDGFIGVQWKNQLPLWYLEVGERIPNADDGAEAGARSTYSSPWSTVPHRLVLGMYTSASLQMTAREFQQINDWLAQNGLTTRVEIAATYMDFEFPNADANIPLDLNAAWNLGIFPFINLAVGTTDLGPRTSAEIALGDLDGPIRRWARHFAAWARPGGKKAYIAPLQEMNGYWTPYGLDPDNFKRAYYRIQRLFAEEGVPDDAVIWVFAPNGWSPTGHDFERYYPGDDYVDIVSFSAFNYGACSGHSNWQTFEVVFQPYLERMREMAPKKPILIAQTGTVANGGDKDTWLVDTFTQFAAFEGMAGVLYFNVIKEESPACEWVDWRVFDPESGTGSPGFIQAMREVESLAAQVSENP